MQAVVYTAPLTIAVMDVDEPVAGPGEVLVDVRAVGICGSELEGFAGQSPFRVPPLVMGHEFAGTRVDTGETVVVNPLISCLVCDLCNRGLLNVCRNRQILGIQRAGGYAERVAVPEENCYPVSPDVPFSTLALAEPIANAVHALRLVQEHDPWPLRVGIIGSGAVGLCLTVVAAARGIPNIEIADPSGDRLALAASAGATATSATLEGEFDVVFDTVGLESTRSQSLRLVRPGGTAVWVGLHDVGVDLDAKAMIRQEVRVLTTFCYDRNDFAVAASIVQQMDPNWIEEFPMSDGDEVFRTLLKGPGPFPKTVLVR